MQNVIAMIKPYKLQSVRNALLEIGVQGMTVTYAKGFGRQRGHPELYRGIEYVIDLLPKIKIEIAVEDELSDLAVKTIRVASNTRRYGDGKIFVYPVYQAVRIRTGESGSDAV